MHPCTSAPFQFNYLDDESEVGERFDMWLEEALTVALEEWRRTL